MTQNQTFTSENGAARERLKTLVAGLSEDDLQKPVGADWTVTTALVHLAFWDRRYLALLRSWERAGDTPAPSASESINAAVQALAEAIPARAAARLALAAAEAIDQELERITPELAAAIDAAGYPNVLRRFIHRNAHLDDIAGALGKG